MLAADGASRAASTSASSVSRGTGSGRNCRIVRRDHNDVVELSCHPDTYGTSPIGSVFGDRRSRHEDRRRREQEEPGENVHPPVSHEVGDPAEKGRADAHPDVERELYMLMASPLFARPMKSMM